MMKYTTTALLALAAGANAHTLFSEFYVNGVGQGSGTCVRTPYEAEGAVDPIRDLGSDDMVCGKNGEAGVARTCSVKSGSSITFEYRQWPDDVSRGPLDHGHMGPCSVYLKKVGNAATDSGAGDGWFKLWDEGYDSSDSGPNPWCTQRMIANEGRITVTLPESLQGGDYLIRPELLALHNAGPKGAPEFYVGCAQVFLESSGTQGPASTVSIPGHVNMSSPAVTFDVWQTPMDTNYPIPGPGVATFAGAMGTASTTQTDGLVSDCVATNNNWCGKELPDYSDETGCWAADKDCWAQVQACWDAAGAVGGVGCKIMEDKCFANQAVCNSGSSASGPANKGKFLGPEASTIPVPSAVNGGSQYGGSDAPAAPASSAAASSAYVAPSSSSAYVAPAPASSAAASSEVEAAPASSAYSAPAYSAPPSYEQAPSSAAYIAPAETTPTPAAATPAPAASSVVGADGVVTIVEYVTVTDEVYVTATAPAGYKNKRHLHEHRMHARHH